LGYICLLSTFILFKSLNNDYKLPEGVEIKQEPVDVTPNNDETSEVDSDDDDVVIVEEAQPEEEDDSEKEEEESEDKVATPTRNQQKGKVIEGKLDLKKTISSKTSTTDALSKKQNKTSKTARVFHSEDEEDSIAPTTPQRKSISSRNKRGSTMLDSDNEERMEHSFPKKQAKTHQDTRLQDTDDAEEEVPSSIKKTKNARMTSKVFPDKEQQMNQGIPDIWEKLSDDEKNEASPSTSKVTKKSGMSWETYIKNPEVVKKLAPKSDFWGKSKLYYLGRDDCENFVVIAVIENNNKGGNSLSFPHHFFHNGIECAAKCQLDVDIIDKYSPSLENNGQECQRRAIPHGKNECSFNTYMNVKTDHKISVFVIGRQTNSIKKDLSDMQNLFDAIVASESFMKMCQEQAKNASRQGPSMIAMQEDDSAVWNYLQGSLHGNTVFEVTQIHHLDHLLMDMDIKLVLKAMYGDKIFKTKADVGWKNIKIR